MSASEPNEPRLETNEGQLGYADFRERIRSEFVKWADQVAEQALAGELIGMVAVTLGSRGELNSVFLGIRPTEAIGMHETTSAMLKRKIMA